LITFSHRLFVYVFRGSFNNKQSNKLPEIVYVKLACLITPINLTQCLIKKRFKCSFSIDDIEDNSILRRGIPVAHSIYGVASTINSANYVLFLALEKVQLLGHPDATKVYTEQLLELHRGQGMEIYWRDNFLCPEESEYKLMTIRKTGGLFMLAIRLMLLFSDNKKDFTKLTVSQSDV
jgi:geranylgeranyl diphosphate synthase, type III